jgi:hypothetical protein
LKHRGDGLSAASLDARTRVSRAAEQVVVRAVVAHAVEQNAATFCERFCFETFARHRERSRSPRREP